MLELVLATLLAASPPSDGHAAQARPAAAPTTPAAPSEPSAPRAPRLEQPLSPRSSPPPQAAPPARRVPEAQLAEGCALPPAVTSAALREELRSAAKARKDELAQLAHDRASLERLAADVAAARAALAAETAKLEERTRAERAAGRPDPAKAAEAGEHKPGDPQKPAPIDPTVKANAEGLAKALKVMKPDQSAVLVARLERPLAVALLRKMKPADAGAVLEKMKPELATELISLMARTGGTP